jgi:predicted ester cyclase
MSRDEIFALFANRQVHWRNRDPAGLAATHALNGVVHSPIFGKVEGAKAIEVSYQNLFAIFNDWTFEAEQALVDGDRVAQPFKVTATHTSELFGVAPTNRRFEIQGVLLFEFADGRISRERRVYDFTSLLIQVGVLKARPRD